MNYDNKKMQVTKCKTFSDNRGDMKFVNFRDNEQFLSINKKTYLEVFTVLLMLKQLHVYEDVY